MPVTLRQDPSALVLTFADGTNATLPHLWLRDADPAGFHPETNERVFDILSVPADIAPENARIEDGALRLRWPGAITDSRFTLDWLAAHAPGRRRPDAAALPKHLWGAELTAAGIPRADASAILDDDAALFAWLQETKRFGLSIVTGLPDDAKAGMAVAERVGFLAPTNFGTIFEVKSKPDPNNIAYTAEALPLHTDLPNQELPPGVQFLHCLANDATGGGSVVCDGLRVARDFAQEDPEGFALLRDTPVPFRFFDDAFDIRTRHPVIVTDADGAVSELCYSTHIADVLDLPAEILPAWYAAFRALTAKLRDPAYTLTLRLEQGQMIVFDNRRVLHGRERFDPSTGQRHLRGFYVNRGDFDSRIRVLARASAPCPVPA